MTQLSYAVMVMHGPSGVHKFALNNLNRWGGQEGFSTPKVSALQITPPVELSGNCHHSQMEASVSVLELRMQVKANGMHTPLWSYSYFFKSLLRVLSGGAETRSKGEQKNERGHLWLSNGVHSEMTVT